MKRSSASRCTHTSRRRRRCSAAASSNTAPARTRAPARFALRIPVRCPFRTGARSSRRSSSASRSAGEGTVGCVRTHREEDTPKTGHAGGDTGRSVGADYSLVDFNRGGTPLVEIVSRTDIRSAYQALRFLRLLRQTIVELGISDAEMEKGTMRADVNVSVREHGEEGFRPRWELKNMNSF